MTLDNREIASLVWLAVFIAWALSVPSVRGSLRSLMAALAAPAIAITLTLMSGFVVLTVLALAWLHLWDQSHLKDTVIWVFAFAVPMLFEIPAISRDVKRLRKAIRDVFTILVLLEFFMNLYVMSLPAELLLVPTLTVVGLLLVVAERSERHAQVVSVMRAVQGILGWAVFLFVVFTTLRHVREVASAQTLRDLLLPAVLSILYVPFLYGMALYAAYDHLFRRFGFLIDDPSTRALARRRTLLTCHINLKALIAWSRLVGLSRLETVETLSAALERFQTARHRG